MENLTHGWEPTLDASDSMLRAFVFANAECRESIAARVGGRTRRLGAVSLADPASPVFFDNGAVLLQPPAYVHIETVVGDVLAFFPPERHFVLLSAWPTPDLSAFGFSLMGHPPLMLRPRGGDVPPIPPGLAIREVDDAASLSDFLTTLIRAYPMPGAETSPFSDVRILDPSLRLFVGYVGGVPVATAGVHIGQGLNDVEWVSTMPDHRGRGIGAALTWAATMGDPALPAALIASDDGQPVYKAMGYIGLMRLTMWHRPPG